LVAVVSVVRLQDEEERDRQHVLEVDLDQKCAISLSDFQSSVGLVRTVLVR
jgi:hypothetical protein